MLSHFLLIFGVLTLTIALRSFNHPVLQKLGAISIFATSFLIGYLFTGSWAVGMSLAATWLFLPWFDLVLRIRKLSLPRQRDLLHKPPPNSHHFPELGELTEEIEGESFEHVDDSGWEWDGSEQFFRLFYKAEERMQAEICLVDQNDVPFYYISISSRAKDGTTWKTWNYPFSYSLKLTPQTRVQRLRGDASVLELVEAHRSLLLRNGVALDQLEVLGKEAIQEEIQKDLETQIAHNVAAGVLTPDPKGGVRYSWRGLIYLWVQFLRELVRLS